MASLDNLPSLALAHIFRFLSVDDLFRLRVCKSLKNEFESLHFESLFLYRGPYRPHKRWYYPSRLVGHQNSFQATSPLGFLKSPVCKKYFKGVKNLLVQHLAYGREAVDYESHLNEYEQLEHLELDCSFNCLTILKLKNLKALCLSTDSSTHLKFETPNLETLVCKHGPGELIDLSGHQLKYLECEYMPKNIADFRNLQTLVVTRFDQLQQSLLERLSELTEIHIYVQFFDYLNELVQSLIKQKRQLKRKNLRIIGGAFEELITEQTSISFYYGDNFYVDEWAMNDIRDNYAKLVFGIHFECGINYSNVYEGFDSRIPDDFHLKFTNITFVDASKVRNYDDFLNFLSKSPSITAITFDQTELGQALLSRLPAACPALTQLRAKKCTLNTQNNYGFLASLTCLTSLYLQFCTPALCPELIEALFANSRYFSIFATTDERLNVRVERKESKQFELKILDKESQCKTIDEVCRLLRKSKLA